MHEVNFAHMQEHPIPMCFKHIGSMCFKHIGSGGVLLEEIVDRGIRRRRTSPGKTTTTTIPPYPSTADPHPGAICWL